MAKKLLGGLGKVKKLLMAGQDVPDVHYADPLKPATMRMSEALGNVGAEGKTLNFTEADRSRVFGSNRGGVGFSGLQHYSDPHKKANTVWGFGNKTTAEKKVRQNDPENSLWTTFVGSPNQHKSNTVVLQDAVKEFQNAVKAGKVHPAQIKLMNERLRAAKDEDTGLFLFDQGYDLTDPSALGAANTFARRSTVGDVLLGEGVKGTMRGKAFKEEHGSPAWTDAGRMEDILKRETDPDLVGAGTYDVGNRLFVLDNNIIERSDLNEAFPFQVTGNDLGMKYQLVPPDKAMRNFYKEREGRLNKNQKPSPVSYYDLARAKPSQFVDEDYLTFLQKEGHKKGGAIDIKAADERLAAAIEKRMAKGGAVDIEAADARLQAAIDARLGMADGGGAFKKLEFMADGGKLIKGAKKAIDLLTKLPAGTDDSQKAVAAEMAARKAAQEAAYAPHTLPTAQGNKTIAKAKKTLNPQDEARLEAELREKAKNKLLQGNHPSVPKVVYHGTKQDFSEFKPKYDDNLSFFSTNPEFASKWPSGSGGLRELSPENKEHYEELKKIEEELKQKYMQSHDYDDPDWASKYDAERAKVKADMLAKTGFSSAVEYENKAGIQVMPVNLSVKNPFHPPTHHEEVEELLNSMPNMQGIVDKGLHKEGNWIIYENPEVIKHLKKKGYDAIWLSEDVNGPHETIAPFTPNQIKSATGNRGTYDINDPDITKAHGGIAMAKGGKFGNFLEGAKKVGKALMAPQDEALKLAQERAALPPAKGGLGLPKNNTPEQRAKAMGFDRDTYHGSVHDIKKFDSNRASTESHAGRGVYSTDSPRDASENYASIYGADVAGKVDRGMEQLEKDWRRTRQRMKDEALTPRQQQIILGNTVNADNIGVVYPLKVRSDKPIHLDKPESNPHMVGPFERYDETSDMYVDTPNTPRFNRALKEYDEMGGETNPIREFMLDYADEEGKVPARDLFNTIKKEGNDAILYDPYSGDMVSGGVAAGDFMQHFDVDEIRHTPQFMNPQLNIGGEHTISMNPDNVRSRFAAFDPFRKNAAIAAAMGVAAPDLLAKETKPKEKKKAEGGGAFKTLQWKDAQHFDGGGIAVDLSEPSEDARREPVLTEKDWSNIKRNAPDLYKLAKQQVMKEASQLKTAGGAKDFALRTGAQYLGGIPDLINLGLMGVDAGLDTNLSSERPWLGSERYLDALKSSGAIGENEFPLAEITAGILAPAGLIRKGMKKMRKLPSLKEEPKKRLGGLTALSR